MGSKPRKKDSKNNLILDDTKIEKLILRDVFQILKQGTKASEKEAENKIDNFIRSLD